MFVPDRFEFLAAYDVHLLQELLTLRAHHGLHLSLQAGDDMILKRMKRRHLRQDAIDFCNKLSEREGLRPCYRRAGNEATILDGTACKSISTMIKIGVLILVVKLR